MRTRAHFARIALLAALSAASCSDDPAAPAADTTLSPDTGDAAAPDDTAAPPDDAADTDPGPDSALPGDTAAPEDTALDTAAPDDTAAPEDSAQDTTALEDATAPTDTIAPTDTTAPADTTAPDPYAGLADGALRAVLAAETAAGHTPLGYDGARDEMYAVGGIDDVGGRIECIYTGRTVDATGSRTPNKNCTLVDGTPATCRLNTEHTWARYYLDLALTEGSQLYYAAEGDIHHIFPSDEVVNNARWHFDFGETTCLADGNCKVNEQSQLGQRPGVTGFANCPTGNLTQSHVCLMRVRPLRQGDLARGQFYMAVRYAMPMDDAMEAALRAWNLADPPDARERARNDAIEAAQGNRNPFVDRPDLVDRISDF